MASLKWNAASGAWTVPGNWAIESGSDSVPGPATDVMIDAGQSGTISIDGVQAVHDLSLAAATAKLLVSGTLGVGGTIVQTAGTIVLGGAGMLQGGTLMETGGFLTGSGGTLDGLTVAGALTFGSTADLKIVHGLTILGPGGTGTGTIATSLGPKLTFLESTTLDSATVFIDGKSINVASGMTLTLGQNLTTKLLALNPADFGGAGTVVNRGTISGQDGHSIIRFTSDFRNEGTVDLQSDFLSVTANLTNDGVIALHTLGNLSVGGGLSGTGTIAIAGTLQVGGAIGAGVHVVPTAVGAVIAAATIDPGATIEAAIGVQKLDFRSIPISGATTVDFTGNYAGGTLSVRQPGTVLASVFVTGINPGATFLLTGDSQPSPGTLVTITNAPCFLEGTLIRTVRGDVPVEALRIGDRVPALRSGTALAVSWIGHRSVLADRYRNPEDVWPVCIMAGAIADRVPYRDLWLSPEHAVFLHGVLVPARHLINGRSIRQIPRSRLRYFHVELPVHDLVLSEGLPTESYLDTGNRSDFENAGEVIAAHPRFASSDADSIWRSRACFPQVRHGDVLASIRSVLDRRAASHGFAARRVA